MFSQKLTSGSAFQASSTIFSHIENKSCNKRGILLLTDTVCCWIQTTTLLRLVEGTDIAAISIQLLNNAQRSTNGKE